MKIVGSQFGGVNSSDYGILLLNLQLEWFRLSTTFWKNKKRYAYLVV